MGNAYEVFLKAVDEVHQQNDDVNYAKILPVTQSSGTGKSRVVDQIATKRVLFPLCLREDLGDNYYGVNRGFPTWSNY